MKDEYKNSRRDFIKGSATLLGSAALASIMPSELGSGAWATGSDAPEKKEVRVEFIPLTDCASVVVAAAMRFDEKYGIKIVLSKEASWAGGTRQAGEWRAGFCAAIVQPSVLSEWPERPRHRLEQPVLPATGRYRFWVGGADRHSSGFHDRSLPFSRSYDFAHHQHAQAGVAGCCATPSPQTPSHASN